MSLIPLHPEGEFSIMGCRIHGGRQFFAFSPWKILCDFIMFTMDTGNVLFLFGSFKNLFFVCSFRSIIMCLAVYFPNWVILWACVFCQIWDIFSLYFFKYSLIASLSLLTGTPKVRMLDLLLLLFQQVTEDLFVYFFEPIFSVVQVGWILLFHPQIQGLSSVISTLLLSPFTEFLPIVFFISTISIF